VVAKALTTPACGGSGDVDGNSLVSSSHGCAWRTTTVEQATCWLRVHGTGSDRATGRRYSPPPACHWTGAGPATYVRSPTAPAGFRADAVRRKSKATAMHCCNRSASMGRLAVGFSSARREHPGARGGPSRAVLVTKDSARRKTSMDVSALRTRPTPPERRRQRYSTRSVPSRGGDGSRLLGFAQGAHCAQQRSFVPRRNLFTHWTASLHS
jgi:hypothetical protein